MSELVRITGVPASSIHHYRRLGLVPEPARATPNRFVYDSRHVVALEVIRAMRMRGVPLAQIEPALRAIAVSPSEPGAVEAAVDDYLSRTRVPGSARTRLVEAAIESFATRGYRDVSIARLCDQAGVAKGTFYRYFEGKDALFLAAAATVIDRVVEEFTTDLSQGVQEERWVVLARRLRHGLPVMLELAKQSIQESGAPPEAAALLFYGLADRIGRAVGAEDPGAEGGFAIMMAVVEIFMGLVEPAGTLDAT